jgi:PAS domain S-box-containing protein
VRGRHCLKHNLRKDDASKIGHRILIVADDLDHARSLADALERSAYEVTVVHSAARLPDALQQSDSDAVVVDVQQVDVPGVIGSLHELRPGLKFVVLTSASVTEPPDAAQTDHIYARLTKSIPPPDLLSTMDHCFESIAQRRQKQRAEEEVSRRTTELESISQKLTEIPGIAAEFAALGTADDLNARLLNATAKITGAQAGVLFFLRGATLEPACSIDPHDTPESIVLGELPDDSWLAEVVRSRQPASRAAPPTDGELGGTECTGCRDRSTMAFPLVDEKDESFGLIMLHDKAEPFSVQDLDLGRIIISLATGPLLRRRADDSGKRLQDSETVYRSIFEASQDGIMIIDDETFVNCNSFACELLGMTREEIFGRSPRELSPERQVNGADSSQLAHDRFQAAPGEEPPAFEWRFLRRDGTVVDTEISLNRIETGDTSFLRAIVRDITARRRAEDRDRAQSAHLFHTAKMASLGTLVSGVAHEINNPNNLIRLSTGNLADFWEDIAKILWMVHQTVEPVSLRGIDLASAEAMIGSMIDGLNEGSVRIENLVKGLTDYARRDTRNLDEAVNLNQVVESAQTILASLIKTSTWHFSFSPAKDLPSIVGNYHQIEQIVISLLNNACQALGSMEKAVRIATSYDSAASLVVLVVEDEGVGIPGEYLPQITDPFFTTKRDIGGTGLGLSVSQSIVQNHGGDLAFCSEVGVGTTVTVSLPRRRG